LPNNTPGRGTVGVAPIFRLKLRGNPIFSGDEALRPADGKVTDFTCQGADEQAIRDKKKKKKNSSPNVGLQQGGATSPPF